MLIPHTPHFYLWINNEAAAGEVATEIHNPFDGKLVAGVAPPGEKELEIAGHGQT